MTKLDRLFEDIYVYLKAAEASLGKAIEETDDADELNNAFVVVQTTLGAIKDFAPKPLESPYEIWDRQDRIDELVDVDYYQTLIDSAWFDLLEIRHDAPAAKCAVEVLAPVATMGDPQCVVE